MDEDASVMERMSVHAKAQEDEAEYKSSVLLKRSKEKAGHVSCSISVEYGR